MRCTKKMGDSGRLLYFIGNMLSLHATNRLDVEIDNPENQEHGIK